MWRFFIGNLGIVERVKTLATPIAEEIGKYAISDVSERFHLATLRHGLAISSSNFTNKEQVAFSQPKENVVVRHASYWLTHDFSSEADKKISTLRGPEKTSYTPLQARLSTKPSAAPSLDDSEVEMQKSIAHLLAKHRIDI